MSKKFKKVNREKVKSKKMELEKFPGFLPGLLDIDIDSYDWWQFLERKGLYNQVMEQREKTRHQSFEEDKLDLIHWCEENPQYADFIIWEDE